ncbi:bacteriocin [Candidatus Formimonas warabiya]|nr:bacteriocin [Candidatus Formimonas warabiya]
MRDEVTKKEGDILSEEELDQVTGGIEHPKPPTAPGSGGGM